MTPLDPPNSPPNAPVIPEGLATKLGKYGAALFFVLAAAIYAFDLDLNLEAIVTAGFGGITLWAVLWGRYKQAVAALQSDPFAYDDVLPDESDLQQKFPFDPPVN